MLGPAGVRSSRTSETMKAWNSPSSREPGKGRCGQGGKFPGPVDAPLSPSRGCSSPTPLRPHRHRGPPGVPLLPAVDRFTQAWPSPAQSHSKGWLWTPAQLDQAGYSVPSWGLGPHLDG